MEPAHLLDAAQIKIFLSIVEARSFSRTAAVLSVKQPSFSAQVKRIETELGRPLFRRCHTGIDPTRDGEAVAVNARAVLALSD